MKGLAPLILPFLLLSSPSNENVTYLQQEETIHIGIDEEVDLSNSTVLWNGEELELKDDLSFTVEKEGKNTLDYVLKDSDGNVVKEGTNIYILDSKKPEIVVVADSFTFEKNIGVWNELEVEIQIEEENSKRKEIYIDDILQEEKDTYTLTDTNKTLKIVVEDECGNLTEKEYTIQSIDKPEISSSITDPFTLESSIEFTMDDTCQLYVNDEKVEGKKYSFVEPDSYFFEIKYKDYPYINFYQQTVTYTDIVPSINIQISSLKGNQDVTVLASYEGDIITSASFTSSNGQSIDFDQVNVFKAKENQNQIITLQAIVEDAYGQCATKEVTFQICTIKPTMEIVLNKNKVFRNEIISFINVDSILVNHTGTKTEKYYLNDQLCSFSSLEEALKSMNGSDELNYVVHLKDEFGNENDYTYLFRKESILQNIVSTSTNRTTGTQSQREWSVDENNHVTLKESEVETIQKPIVYIEDEKNLQMGQTIDIVLINAENIQWLKVNGEEVDLNTLKKDSLNNLVYTYTLPNQETLKIEMKDSQNQIDTKEYTIQPKQTPAWLYCLFPILLILGIVIGMRYV